MLSSVDTEAPSVQLVDGVNGTVQVSRGGSAETIGLLVEREGRAHGLLLSRDSAKKVAEFLAAD